MYNINWWLSCRISALQSVVAGSISCGGDHSICCWWDLIKSKHLSSVSICCAYMVTGFYGHSSSIHNIFFIIQIKKISESKKNKSINEKYLVCYYNKKNTIFLVANLEWSEKSNCLETLSLFLSLPCCCQCRFKRYIAKQTNAKTEETIPLWCQPGFLTNCLLFFLSLSMWQATNHEFFLSFSLYFLLSQKITAKNVGDLTFHSFFLSSFYFFLLFISFFFFLI